MKKSKKNKEKTNKPAEEIIKAEETKEPATTKKEAHHNEDESTKALKAFVIPESEKSEADELKKQKPIISGEIPESDEVIALPSEIPYVPEEIELPVLPQVPENKQASVLPTIPGEQKPEEVPEEKSELKSEKSRNKRFSDQLSDDEAFELLGPESTLKHLAELLLGMVPVISAIACFLWISLGGTLFSVSIIAIPGAAVLALFLFWALGGCKNVNRRRFARAYFLWLVCLAAIGAVIALLAYAFGAELSPIIRKIMNIISSVK